MNHKKTPSFRRITSRLKSITTLTVRAMFAAPALVACALILISAATTEAATYSVTNTADSGAGSLRDAVAVANSSTADDTINFNIAGCPNGVCTISLTSGSLFAENLPVAGKLTIRNSTGANNLIISGNNQSRVFYIKNSNIDSPGSVFTLDGVTVAQGNATDSVNTNGDNGRGGAMYLGTSTSVTISNCIFRNNIGYRGGGAIYNQSGSFDDVQQTIRVFINNTTFNNNTASGNPSFVGRGGAINNAGSIQITSSTINNNSAQNGGGIFNNQLLLIYNTTISGNVASGGSNCCATGGGISDGSNASAGGGFQIINSTISGNSAVSYGGGLYVRANVGSFIRNTIVAGNTSAGVSPDIYILDSSHLFRSRGNNLIGNSSISDQSGVAVNWQATDILNQPANLAPLADNGGATQTQALLANSAAINVGNNCVLTANGCGDNNPAITADQRGFNRQVGASVDIGAFEFGATAIPVRRPQFDFDGDGKADVSVFRPANGAWYLLQSANGFTGVTFGFGTDKLVPADYDGDGKTDVAVFRNGTWYLQRSQLGFTGIAFGASDDIPVPADYDGDGKADVAVFRPSNGAWYLLQSSLGFTGIQFGISTDKPIPADYDGDGKADIAVNRGGIWYIQRSQLGFTGVQFGDGNDKPVPADYDGDGKADVAVFRPSNGVWYLQQSTGGFTGIQFGLGTDTPTAADYDGDGKADVAVFRNGVWYLNRTTTGFTGIAFGASTDLPTEAAFVR